MKTRTGLITGALVLMIAVPALIGCGGGDDGETAANMEDPELIVGWWQNVDERDVVIKVTREAENAFVITLINDPDRTEIAAVFADTAWLIGEPFAGAHAEIGEPDRMVIRHGTLEGVYERTDSTLVTN